MTLKERLVDTDAFDANSTFAFFLIAVNRSTNKNG